jgi:hypothetical protein
MAFAYPAAATGRTPRRRTLTSLCSFRRGLEAIRSIRVTARSNFRVTLLGILPPAQAGLMRPPSSVDRALRQAPNTPPSVPTYRVVPVPGSIARA